MVTRPLFRVCLIAVGVCAVLQHCRAAKPNILLILADDMGYGDLGCMGSVTLQTPHLDSLAASGILCTQAYVASSVCSPSRAGLLTGRDPRRFGYEENLNQSSANYATRPDLLGLPPGEHTLGDHLNASGYSTCLIGKWHLGTGDGFHPNRRGFDYFSGMLGGSHTYFPKPRANKLERNGKQLREFSSAYLTDFFTDECVSWIAQQADSTPWFMFLSYNAPHGPLEATEADLANFDHIQDPKRKKYAAMMLALDRGVGRILSQIQSAGQRENTLICFLSDNGGATNNASWNGPLSGTKGCLREGGVRVPMIWSWPSRLPAGETHSGVMSSLDLLPTFLAASGSEPLPLGAARGHEDKSNRRRAVAKYGEYDGVDLLPQLTGKSASVQRTLFWRLQGQAAILNGDEKLIRLSHRPAQLFRPGKDSAEARDLIDADRNRAIELFQALGQWESTLTTVPLWGSSPYWIGQSANHYDTRGVRPEPQ